MAPPLFCFLYSIHSTFIHTAAVFFLWKLFVSSLLFPFSHFFFFLYFSSSPHFPSLPVDGEYNKEFSKACERGDIKRAQKLLSTNQIDVNQIGFIYVLLIIIIVVVIIVVVVIIIIIIIVVIIVVVIVVIIVNTVVVIILLFLL